MELLASQIPAPVISPLRQRFTIMEGPEIHVATGYSADAKLQQLLGLRYRVYCEECQFLPSADYPFHLESDSYDERSKHFMAMQADTLLAGVRLVLNRGTESFPFQEHCNVFDGFELPAARQSAEISRLVTDKSLRRRNCDTIEGISSRSFELSPIGGITGRYSQNQVMLLSLYRSMYRFSKRTGIRYWYAAMEKPLHRSLQQMGFVFRAIGPDAEYYGKVAPYVADLHALEVELMNKDPVLGHWFIRDKVQIF